ncbi:MAG: polysaccharide deacetylase family protein [Lentisphaeria bacterium]|nr:polysaccharide deacetylase family protein [Lentisphaeria bacterium]
MAASTSFWPDGRQGAVSLTFDDGTPNQLATAVPLVQEHGLRGTFYVCPRGDDFEERCAPWRGVSGAF